MAIASPADTTCVGAAGGRADVKVKVDSASGMIALDREGNCDVKFVGAEWNSISKPRAT